MYFLADYAFHIYGLQNTHQWGPIIAIRPPSRPAPQVPMSEIWSSTQAPKLKLELVSMKRLTACLWRPTWLMSDRTCTVPRGDISPYSLPSVHVARSTVGARCRLRFPLYVNHLTLTLPSLFHSLSVYLFKHPCFEHSILFSQIPRLLEA